MNYYTTPPQSLSVIIQVYFDDLKKTYQQQYRALREGSVTWSLGDQAEGSSTVFNMWLSRLLPELASRQKVRVACDTGDFHGLGLKVGNDLSIYISLTRMESYNYAYCKGLSLCCSSPVTTQR